MATLRKLPVGIQSFENIRTDGYIYVDKTEFIYNLVNTGKTYFLSRPRRFGKSLLLSTMKAYFEGRRDLFEGLKIAELEKDWTKYPVLHFDFASENYKREGALEGIFDEHFLKWEKVYGVPAESVRGISLARRFKRIVEAAVEKTGQKAVVLVDEYDKSLLEAESDVLEKARDIYKSVFINLKSLDDLIKFSFITGITKFTRTSIFSDLNQLEDISLTEDYSELCGITQEELELNFAPEIDALAKKNGMTHEECLAKLKKMYDGYLFCENGKKVYNPFSLINALKTRRFDNWWFGTATPTMLIRSLEKNNFDPIEFDGGDLTIQGDELTDYRVDSNNPVPLFYQSGYLTIKNYDSEYREYHLGYPNDEVKYAFLKKIVPMMTGGLSADSDFNIRGLNEAAKKGDTDTMRDWFTAVFAKLPYPTGGGDKKAAAMERDFQNVVYLSFSFLGAHSEVERHSALGRADCIVKTKDFIYIFEFKLDKPADDALRQIDEKGYAKPFAADKRAVIKIGVSVSSEIRNIAEWKVI